MVRRRQRKSITYVAPVSVSFEDIPGDSKGFFSPAEKRIAVQEGMSESHTLKTMVHETAHSMLHDKEVNKDILAPAKDRNTKEVEAESIAYTVCQHFGIDTSEYSFGYIAGWSTGRDMRELKSSLDTIRRTASELITGIEEQLREIQRDRESYPAFYGHTLVYAMEHGEVDKYMDSRKLDRECKEAVEGTIRQNFDGMHLNHDIVKPLAEQYGSDRIAFVLANTLQQESWDERFSRDNKAWAAEFYIPENLVHGIDVNRELIVSSHPAVLDGFIDMFRREVLEKEKEMSAAQEKEPDTSGHDVKGLSGNRWSNKNRGMSPYTEDDDW